MRDATTAQVEGIEATHQIVDVRVVVQRGSESIDLTNYLSENWFVGATITHAEEQPAATCYTKPITAKQSTTAFCTTKQKSNTE